MVLHSPVNLFSHSIQSKHISAMTFVAAKCLSCAEAIQVPDDRDAIKCMCCGMEIMVREVINLPAYQTNAFTVAHVNFRTSNSPGLGIALMAIALVSLLVGIANVTDSGAIGSVRTPGAIGLILFVSEFSFTDKRRLLRLGTRVTVLIAAQMFTFRPIQLGWIVLHAISGS